MTLPASKFFALALAGLSLGACTARDPARTSTLGTSYASLDATLDGPRPAAAARAPASAQAATPVAVLPDWIGRPSRLRERDEADAFEQAVSLALAPRDAGDNLVLVSMPRTASAASGETLDGRMMMGSRPTEAGIRSELAAIFPDTPMQIVTRPAANTYGPYGLAIGRSPSGARCLYAWQWLAEAPALETTGKPSGPLSLRVRICRDDVTLEAIAAAMNQLKLVARFAGTPVDLARSRNGSAVPRRQRVAHLATARPRHAARVRSPEATSPGSAAGEGGTAATVRGAESPVAGAAFLPAGRRYLGATETPVTQPEMARDAAFGATPSRLSSGGAAPAAQAGTLSADLPPEALRGPSARPSGRL